ncbi:3-hydroxyacyl-CoA dehydrogenase family protein [Cryptosporangium arvum]|uniref:3-hydroxyacyl-CoA dehydrogenase n=1 Tax=Cryptosporangium arvum DSM 44712 TaxID=927661 RepID=A0A010ZTV5_9ACTN|nr:3-hydroxyacyl-CoA dehydrogenase family protein [Cryptosporangium arvum]EXG82134.1 3-hydroxyacyl-CoA dehydrogenase [Cryptosporangium arvum DSM 44712]
MTQERGLAILGAGVMGTGITTLALAHGIPVTLIDVSDEVLADARDRVRQQLRHAQLMGAVPGAVAALTTSTDRGAVGNAVAVVEAVVEDVEVKTSLLGDVCARLDEGTPLVTNTSGIPIDELAKAVGRPHELVGIHFMNPAYLITTVEVARGSATGDAAMDTITALLARMGRRGIVVRDSPGFVTSRLLHPMINEAARIVGEGVTSAAAVDELMQACLGHPTGPLRTADLIGLDNLADALRALADRTGIDRYRPCELLEEKVAAGHLGRKSGQGFYEY